METITDTLNERGARYGKFALHAVIVQELKAVVLSHGGYMEMKPDARQAVEVIFDKIARMINGDPEYDDNWRDIVGYATLVLNRILEDQNGPELPMQIARTIHEQRTEDANREWLTTLSPAKYAALGYIDKARYIYNINDDTYTFKDGRQERP